MRTYSSVPGWFDYSALYDAQVSGTREGGVMVEIGCWMGRSLIYLAEVAYRAGKSLNVYGVDHGLGSPEHEKDVAAAGGTIIGVLARNLLECGVSEKVTLIVADSARAALLFAPESVDFVFIDAAHDYESVCADLIAWWPRVRRGGVLAGHDYAEPGVTVTGHEFPGVTRAVDEFFGRTALHSAHCLTCWQVTKGTDGAPLLPSWRDVGPGSEALALSRSSQCLSPRTR